MTKNNRNNSHLQYNNMRKEYSTASTSTMRSDDNDGLSNLDRSTSSSETSLEDLLAQLALPDFDGTDNIMSNELAAELDKSYRRRERHGSVLDRSLRFSMNSDASSTFANSQEHQRSPSEVHRLDEHHTLRARASMRRRGRRGDFSSSSSSSFAEELNRIELPQLEQEDDHEKITEPTSVDDDTELLPSLPFGPPPKTWRSSFARRRERQGSSYGRSSVRSLSSSMSSDFM